MHSLFLLFCTMLTAKLVAKDLTIIHTNDLHSHFKGSLPTNFFTVKTGDHDPIRGHYARVAHQLKNLKRQFPYHILVDAGDFYSGSIFHTIAVDKAQPAVPELQFFHRMNYDAITLGNHEFDAGESGLALMLEKARFLNLNIPLVSANIAIKNDSPLYAYGPQGRFPLIKPYRMKTVNGLRVAMIGLLGPDGAFSSSEDRKYTGFIGYDDQSEKKGMKEFIRFTKKLVTHVKTTHDPDVVVVIMHGGSPEDRILAEKVPEIDVIISGHTHEVYHYQHGKTIISQAGCFGQYIGVIQLQMNDGFISVAEPPKHILIDDRVPSDKATLAQIESYEKGLPVFVGKETYKADTEVFTLEKPILKSAGGQSELGRFFTTAILQELNKHTLTPVDLYFTLEALIRKNMVTVEDQSTPYTFADIFSIAAIGFDENLKPGMSLSTFYLQKQDLLNLIEFTEFFTRFSPVIKPAVSRNLTYRVGWGVPLVNRIKDLKLNGLSWKYLPEFVHVAMPMKVAHALNKITKMSLGFSQVTPRNLHGNPIVPSPNGHLPKEVILFADYLSGL